VRDVRKIAGPFLDESDESYQPYIFNGTCIYTARINVPKSIAYRFFFANIDLKTSHSFAELEKNKWKVLITTDLNCGGLYGKKCIYKSFLGSNTAIVQKPLENPSKLSITSIPSFSLSFTNQTLTASVSVPPGIKKSSENIIGIKTRVFQGFNSLLTKDSIQELSGTEDLVNFTFDLSGIWTVLKSQNLPLRVQMEYYGISGSGSPVLKEIKLP
jgi:hypothetical protein